MKYMKTLGLLAILLIMCVVLIGCGQKMSGTYTYSSNYTITFKGSNYTMKIRDSVYTGKYSVKDNKITLSDAPEYSVFTILDSNTIICEDDDRWAKEQ